MKKDINAHKVFILEKGDAKGTPVVFVHGFPFSHAMWQPQIDSVPEGIRAIFYDVRGHGQSEAGAGPQHIELFADDLLELLDSLKIPKAIVCGLSMGGYIALRAFQKSPDRFSALILSDTKVEIDTDEGRLKRFQNVKVINGKGLKAFTDNFINNIFCQGTLNQNPTVTEPIKEIMMANKPELVAATLIAMAARTDTGAALTEAKIPALVMVGEFDAITPIANAETIHRKIKGSVFHIIPQAGHMANLENVTEFNKQLWGFIEKVR